MRANCPSFLLLAGAGKTHTMEGSKQDPGINFRAMKELFRSNPSVSSLKSACVRVALKAVLVTRSLMSFLLLCIRHKPGILTV